MDNITTAVLDTLKKELQAIFSDGLVTVVGFGGSPESTARARSLTGQRWIQIFRGWRD